MKVHVVMIHHRHGTNLSAHDTAKGAEEEVGRYVADEWDYEMGHEEPYPKDSPTVINQHFPTASGKDLITNLTRQQDCLRQ